jgi:hypothetical protein
MKLLFIITLLLILFLLKNKKQEGIFGGRRRRRRRENAELRRRQAAERARQAAAERRRENTRIALLGGLIYISSDKPLTKFQLHEEFELEINISGNAWLLLEKDTRASNKTILLINDKNYTEDSLNGNNKKKARVYEDTYINIEKKNKNSFIIIVSYNNIKATSNEFRIIKDLDKSDNNIYKIRVKKDYENKHMISLFEYSKNDIPIKKKGNTPFDISNPVESGIVTEIKRDIPMYVYINKFNDQGENKKLIKTIKYTNLNEINIEKQEEQYKKEMDNNSKIIQKLNEYYKSSEPSFSYKRINYGSAIKRDNPERNMFFTLHKQFRITFSYYIDNISDTADLLLFRQSESYSSAINVNIISLSRNLDVKIYQEKQNGFNLLPISGNRNRTSGRLTHIQIEQKLKTGENLDLNNHKSYEFKIKYKTGIYWLNFYTKSELVLIKTTELSLFVNKPDTTENLELTNFQYECLNPPPYCSPLQDISTRCLDDFKHISKPATKTSDIECSFNTECKETEFIKIPAEFGISDRTCEQIKECEQNEFIKTQPVAGISDRICSPASTCDAETQHSISHKGTQDTQCAPTSTPVNIQPRGYDYFSGNIYPKDDYPKDDSAQFISEEVRKNTSINYNIGGSYILNGKFEPCVDETGCYKKDNNEVGKDNPKYFEKQACTKDTNRVCQKCKSCIVGKEYITKFCAGSSDTECSLCKICGEKEFKVEGCTIANRNRNTICKPKTICKGRKQSNTNNYIEPEDGIYTYEFDPGYSMGAESPYIGKDRVCEICDDCPPGSETIGGCVGKNSKVNTKCQKLLNIDKILENQPKCGENKYYNISKARTYLEGVNASLIASAKKKPLNENYEEVPLPDITDEILIREGCVDCIDKKNKDKFYQNENNPGCEGFIGSATSQDRIYIPRTICKPNEMITKKGGAFSDDVCGQCRCPPGKIGTNPDCDGEKVISGCEENIPCSQIDKKKNLIIGLDSGNSNSKVYTYDKPSAYGDTTREDKCKVCDTKCPPGTFQLQECDPLRSTNLVCNDHTTCDPETQIVLEPGTSTNDTICKCIDGYEWQKDNLDQPQYNKPCVEIKGKCWTNPCHEKANCYDNFNKDGSFDDFVCKCNITNNWVETEKLGRGSNGCTKISDTHTHDVNERPHLSPEQSNDYKDLLNLKPNVLNVLHHTDGIEGAPSSSGTFHSSLLGAHIHK